MEKTTNIDVNFIREAASRAIEKFHDKFFPEIQVEYIGYGKNGELAFYFSGSFCLTCGLHDYFEDFAELLSSIIGEKYKVWEKKLINFGYTAWVIIYAPSQTIKKKIIREKAKFLIVNPQNSRIEEIIEI